MNKELSFKENLVWNSVGNFIYLASQWLLSYITTRLIGYEPAGVFSLAMTISGSISTLALYAMRNYQSSDVRHVFSDRTYIASRFVTSATAFAACIAFVGVNFYSPMTAACILAYMLFKIIEAVSDVYQGIMQRSMRMDYIGKSFIAKGTAGLVAFAATMLLTRSLLVSLFSLCLVCAAIVIFYDRAIALSLSTDRSEPTRSSVFRLLQACLPLALFGLLFNTMGQAPRYFLEMTLGTKMLGYYASVAMPVTIVQISASFIFSPLTTPLANHLDEGNSKAFLRLVRRVLVSVGILSVSALAGFSLLGDWMLMLLFGKSIAPYTNLITPLVLSGIMLAFSWFTSTITTVLRQLKPLLVFSVLSFAIVLFGTIPSIDYFGMNGATYILILAMAMFSVGNSCIIYRYFKLQKS